MENAKFSTVNTNTANTDQVKKLAEEVFYAMERGYYCVKGFYPELAGALREHGFEVVEAEYGYCTVSWYKASAGIAANLRATSMRRKSAWFEKFAEDSRRMGMSGFQDIHLYPENITWLINQGFVRVEVFKDPDEVGLGAYVRI